MRNQVAARPAEHLSIGFSASDTGSDNVRATLWTAGAPTDLNIFLDAQAQNEGGFRRAATQINDNGWTIGIADNRLTDERHAYLMSIATVPEPGSLALLAFGLAGLGFSRRNQ